MAVDARTIREAWSSIPSPGAGGVGLERFTGQRMERILSIVAAIGSTALGAQALLAALANLDAPKASNLAMMILVFLPLLWMVLACVTGHWVKQACGTFAVVYVLALLLWPTVVDRLAGTGDDGSLADDRSGSNNPTLDRLGAGRRLCKLRDAGVRRGWLGHGSAAHRGRRDSRRKSCL